MSDGIGTPLTAEQRATLADLREAAKTVDRAIAYRDRMQERAEAADAPGDLILQAAGIL